MSYVVWIVVEDEDSGDDLHFWSVDHFDTEDEAVAHAEEMAAQEYERTGIEPLRLEND